MELRFSWEVNNRSGTQINSQFIMEPDGSLPSSYEPATGPGPGPEKSMPHPEYLFL
jgi:hypothetical protein